MDTDEGITGWGECYNHGPDLALFPLLDYLLIFLEGQDPRRISFLTHYLMQQTRFPPGALGLAAISALDHCMWDISAKALGVPVYRAAGRPCARPGEGLCRSVHRTRPGHCAGPDGRAVWHLGPAGLQRSALPHRHAPASLGRGGAHRR